MPSNDARRSDQGKRSFGSRLRRAIDIPFFRNRSSSKPLPQLSTDETANTSARAPMPPSQADGAPSSAPGPPRIDNAYAAISGPPTGDPTLGSVVYEGLKTALQALSDFSDMFPPLKKVTAGILAVCKIVDTVSGNKADLKDLTAKVVAIAAIVQSFKRGDGSHLLEHRIETFCEALIFQINRAKTLLDNPLWMRIALGTQDTATILKIFQDISILCDVFQVSFSKLLNMLRVYINHLSKMDTQLSIETTVEDIRRHLDSASINKLYHEMISYKTRLSSYGDAVGCMVGTRTTILADLERWALDQNTTKVYWMVGLAGIGKSSIAHTLCEMLDRLNVLGATFFCSRASDKTNNARLIIPVIAHSLAKASPSIKFQIVKAIEHDPALAEPTYINLTYQFQKLVRDPIQAIASQETRMHKIIVIDALDECVNLQVVSSLIRLILQSASDIPVKFFIASRDEELIRSAFNHHPELSTVFTLHEVEKHLVEEDIRTYIEKSLSDLKREALGHSLDDWPPSSELSKLVEDSGRLFVYAATAIRYIRDGGQRYKFRLSTMVNRDMRSSLRTATIDGLYGHILEQACTLASKEELEVAVIKQLISIAVFLRNPLPIQAISSLLQIDPRPYLMLISSVIHVPTQEDSPVAPFHASFPDFVVDPDRCSHDNCPSFPALVPSEGHEMLALKCLEHMNHALKDIRCNIRMTNYTGAISGALKYSCIYWASHLSEVKAFSIDLIPALCSFLHEHLMHWIDSVHILGELQTALWSLGSASETLSHLKTSNIDCNDLELLIDDAHQFLLGNFECIQKRYMALYQSALPRIPKNSEYRIRKVNAAHVPKVPKLLIGLADVWGSAKLVMHNGSGVEAVAVSQNDNEIVSVSDGSRMIRIWDLAMAEVGAESIGHTIYMNCVAVAQDGSVSEADMVAHIWNPMAGKLEIELKSDAVGCVYSLAFTPDDSELEYGWFDLTFTLNGMTGNLDLETDSGGDTHFESFIYKRLGFYTRPSATQKCSCPGNALCIAVDPRSHEFYWIFRIPSNT